MAAVEYMDLVIWARVSARLDMSMHYSDLIYKGAAVLMSLDFYGP